MRRLILVCATLALIFAALPLIAADSPLHAQTAPTPPPTTPDQEVLRQQLGTWLNGFQDVVNTLKSNPATANALAATGSDPSGGLASAQAQVPQLNSTDLAALQTAVAQNPNWQQIPGQIKAAVVQAQAALPQMQRNARGAPLLTSTTPSRQAAQQAQFLSFARNFTGSSVGSGQAARDVLAPYHIGRTAAPRNALAPFDVSTAAAALDTTGTFTGDCEGATAGGSAPQFNTPALYTAAFALNEAQSAIQAIMLATPGVVAIFFVDVPTGVKIAEAVVWGVANVAFLVASQLEAIALDCAQSYFVGIQQSTLPTITAGQTDYTPASSQASVLALKSKAGDMNTEITAVQSVVNTILHCQIEGQASAPPPGGGSSCPAGLFGHTGQPGAVDNVNTTLTIDNTNLTEVQDDTQVTQNNTYALNDTLCNHDTTKPCLSTSILAKARLAIVNLAAFQTLQVRMEIEANLSLQGKNPVALFELPLAKGGYLETAHDITKQTIANEIASGKGVNNAQSYLSQGEAAFAAKQYKAAYVFYAQAYEDAVR